MKADELEGRLKTALDESRMLILGTQVLYGFQFQGVFQESFASLPAMSQYVQCLGAAAITLTICLLVAPSLHHQLRYRGETRIGVLSAATVFASAGLFPLTLGVGAAAYVVFEHLFGTRAGIEFAATFISVSLLVLYGIGFALKRPRSSDMLSEPRTTLLKTKIDQLLTEARVIIPGGQALLGFQFIATLTKPFEELPSTFKAIHAVGLCAVALAVVLLMAPAAIHRIAFEGENVERFFNIGSQLVLAGTVPLAIGIAADMLVVFYRVSGSAAISSTVGLVTLALLFGVWFGYPILLRTFFDGPGTNHG